MEYPWYSSVSGLTIEQGEFFTDCLLPVPPTLISSAADSGSISEQGDAEALDVVVLTQSCDLADDPAAVMVCPVFPLDQWLDSAVTPKNSAKDLKNKLRASQLVGYHVVDRCTLEGLQAGHMVVDFPSAFSVSMPYLKTLASTGKRRRLMPPYREHLAQAFARYYMRIGLPTSLSPIP